MNALHNYKCLFSLYSFDFYQHLNLDLKLSVTQESIHLDTAGILVQKAVSVDLFDVLNYVFKKKNYSVLVLQNTCAIEVDKFKG